MAEGPMSDRKADERRPRAPMSRLAQAAPFRMVDRVASRLPGERCVTVKLFSAAEELLEGDGTVPFPLVLEALCQGAAFLTAGENSGEGRILRIDRAGMEAPVHVGDTLEITSILLESGATGLKAECVGRVNQRIVARVELLIGL
jgi:3-hydroxymyristoyl/3-hydroxydecanoyl-(acyl carrier protein) dehydratase